MFKNSRVFIDRRFIAIFHRFLFLLFCSDNCNALCLVNGARLLAPAHRFLGLLHCAEATIVDVIDALHRLLGCHRLCSLARGQSLLRPPGAIFFDLVLVQADYVLCIVLVLRILRPQRRLAN